MFTKLHSFFNPEQFQGWGKQKKYFEGWYFKVVNADESKAFAFIPGIAMDEHGNKNAFIQVLDGKKKPAKAKIKKSKKTNAGNTERLGDNPK